MNTENRKIQEWAKNCGYTGPIPKVMTSFCNEYTLHVWNDIMRKVKPRHEVERVHRELVIHRLKNGVPLPEAMQKQYVIYHKLQALSNFKEDSLTRITDKQVLLKRSQKRIKDNKFELERMNTSIEAIEMATFLFEEKTNSYAANTRKIRSKADFVENTVFCNNKTLNSKQQTTISDAIREYAEKNYNDVNSLERKKVTALLHIHRNAVFNELCVSEMKLLQDLWNVVETCDKISGSADNEEYKYNNEKFKLYAKCLEHDIEAKMHEEAIEKLQLSVQYYKSSYKKLISEAVAETNTYVSDAKNAESKLLSQMYPLSDIDNKMKRLDGQAVLASLDVFNRHLKKEIVHLSEHLTLRSQNSMHLEGIKSDLQAINESMNIAMDNISTKSENVARELATVEIAKTNAKVALEVLLGINLDYLLPMKDDIVSKELVVFHDYPLEYYKCNNDNDGKTNSIPSRNLSTQPCSDLLSELNVSPLQTPWELLISIHRDLQYLTRLITAVKSTSSLLPSDVKPLSVSDFKHIDKTVQKLVDDLQSAKEQMRLSELSLYKKQFQQVLTDWLGLRFGEFVSVERLFAGKGFGYYEKEFMRYYNML